MRFPLRYSPLVAGLLWAGCQDNTTGGQFPLPAPADIIGVSLDSAIYLNWTDNAHDADPGRFYWYRVYSDSVAGGVCVPNQWMLEGTTVSHEFLASQLPNGVSRCFATSAISSDGLESGWSPWWLDTPRPDGRNRLVWAYEDSVARSGFRFWDDVNSNGYGDAGELGLVQDGSRTDIDFWVHREPDSTLWIVPEFTGDSMQLYQNSPIDDLTSIDLAPSTGYTRLMYQAMPGYGYVFKMVDAGVTRYAGLRVTAVTRQYVIFDWSIQTDPGNPELVVQKPALTGKQVPGSR